MKVSNFIFAASILALCIVGCQRNSTPATTNSTTQPQQVAVVPATEPTQIAPATQPMDSALIIDEKEQWFGPAMLRLSVSDGNIVARLYSDDPSGVLTGKEIVNSYDFEMILPDISDPADIEKAVWVSKSPSSDRQDSPYGIFLNNQACVLQPMDVTVRFRGTPPNVTVMMQGKFWLYRTDQAIAPAPVMVNVIGSLAATVPGK
jgi:hypothetical protein